MVNSTVILYILIGLFALALVGSGLLALLYGFWRYAQSLRKTATDFVTAMKTFGEVAEDLKTFGKAASGISRAGGAMALEIAKLRINVERFATLVMKPHVEKENEKYGYALQTDEDASLQFDINKFVAEGYSEDEARVLAQNQVGLS